MFGAVCKGKGKEHFTRCAAAAALVFVLCLAVALGPAVSAYAAETAGRDEGNGASVYAAEEDVAPTEELAVADAHAEGAEEAAEDDEAGEGAGEGGVEEDSAKEDTRDTGANSGDGATDIEGAEESSTEGDETDEDEDLPPQEELAGIAALAEGEVLAFDASVSSEAELRAAVAAAPTDGTQTEITLTADIELTSGTLDIADRQAITLTGGHTLSCASATATITVNGDLTLADIKVTHSAGVSGNGVFVSSKGTLCMTAGSMVFGNEAINGGGVYIDEHAAFTMEGGDVSGNKAQNGAGVYIGDHSDFTMTGGTVNGNDAGSSGGGVYIGDHSNFTMTEGTVYGNKAGASGGGVYIGDHSDFRMPGGAVGGNAAQNGGGVYIANHSTMTITSGEISDNEAAFGGGIWINPNDYSSLFIDSSAVFSGNSAIYDCDRMPAYNSIYASYIKKADGTWSNSLLQGYNNYDIYHMAPESSVVTVMNSYSATTGAGSYAPGASVTIYAGSRSGYSFSGWVVESGGVTLANTKDATTTFTMPGRGVVVSGTWKKKAPPPPPRSDPPAAPPSDPPKTEPPPEPLAEEPLPSAEQAAVFTPLESPPEKPKPDPPQKPSPVSTPAGGNGDAGASAPPRVESFMSARSAANIEAMASITDAGIPKVSIGGLDIALSGGALNHMVWSLVNLILGILGLAAALVSVVIAFKRKKIDTNKAWLAMAVVMGFLGAAVFLLTEDMRNLMVFIDNWTIVNVIVFCVELFGVKRLFKREKELPQDGSV